VKVVEYADFDCEYCKQFDETMNEVIANEGTSGQVAWVFRNFPLTAIHPNAMKAAEAAECVAQVGGNEAYWKFADSLFENQPVDPIDFAQYAEAAGANPNTVASCEENASSTVDAGIDADIQNAQAVGAQGTPYSLLVTASSAPIVINGAEPYDAVVQLVNQALGKN
jgi:protein-disulfide isomerase